MHWLTARGVCVIKPHTFSWNLINTIIKEGSGVWSDEMWEDIKSQLQRCRFSGYIIARYIWCEVVGFYLCLMTSGLNRYLETPFNFLKFYKMSLNFSGSWREKADTEGSNEAMQSWGSCQTNFIARASGYPQKEDIKRRDWTAHRPFSHSARWAVIFEFGAGNAGLKK